MAEKTAESRQVPGLETVFTVAEVARVLARTTHFIRAEIHAGRLRPARLGTELRIRGRDVDRYLDDQASTGPDPRRDTSAVREARRREVQGDE